MDDQELSSGAFAKVVASLTGLPVSHAWQGAGSAIFLELGELGPPKSGRAHAEGEACLAISWDWRVEGSSRVLFGSSDSRQGIKDGISALQGVTVVSLTSEGVIPELVVEFSSGETLRTMVMRAGDPDWAVKLRGGDWLQARAGRIVIGAGVPEDLTEEEQAVIDAAEAAAGRWGAPEHEPVVGRCHECSFFVWLDGEGPLLSYGCCTADKGPMDGRIVKSSSGCPVFVRTREG